MFRSTKIFIIHFFLAYVLKKVISQITCVDKCKSCDAVQCLECFEGFTYQASTSKCVSNCQYGKYYDSTTKQCLSICPYQSYNDNSIGSCEQLPKCPELTDQGNQYFNTFTNYILVKDKIYVSGQVSSSSTADYSLKIFENKECKKLGSMEGHLNGVIYLSYFTASQLQDSQAQLFSDEKGYIDSLISLSSNEIIEWDQKYGMIKKHQILNDYFIPETKQMIYLDEKHLIINKNETQFGILDYRSWYNDPNPFNFNLYLKLFPVVHLNTIIGYYKGSDTFLYSYSQVGLVKWNKQDLSYKKICIFEDKISQILAISGNVQIIIFSTTTTIQTVFRNQCSEIDFGQADTIIQINLVDSTNNLITTLTQKQLTLYIVQEEDSISSQMYSTDLSSLSFTKKISYLDIYDQKEVDENGQSITKRNLIIVFGDGLLQIYEIAEYIIDQEIPRNLWFIIKLEINLQFQYLPQINHIIVNKLEGNIILLGSELTFVKVNFPQGQIIDKTTRKNISQSFGGHKGKVNGVVGDSFNNRVITYSEDGSFIVWEESVDPFSGTNNARFVTQQYYPYCNLGIQQTCNYSVLKLIFGRSDLLITQYKNDNKIYTWSYLYDAIWLKRIFQLSDNTLPLLSAQFHKAKQKLTLTNQKEMISFDIDTGSVFISRNSTNKFFFGAFEYQSSTSFLNYQIYATQRNATAFFFQSFRQVPTKNQTYNISSDKVGQLKRCDYVEQTTSFYCFANNALYIIESDFFLYTINMVGISAVAYEGGTRNIVIYQQNLKVTYLTWGIVSYAQQRSFTFSASIDSDATATTQVPSMYFFYQNTPVSAIKNQVFAMNPNIDVQQMISFDDKISSIFVNQNNQKIYVGFENGNVQSGYFQTNYILTKVTSNASPAIFYSRVNRSIYYYFQASYYLNLMTLSQLTMSKHKSAMTGMLIDEKYQFFLTYSSEDNTNLYMYYLLNNTFYKQVTNSSIKGTYQLFQDTNLDILISFSQTFNDFQSWNYPNLTKYNNFTEHDNIKKRYDEETVDADGNPILNKAQYAVIQNIFNMNNATIISINNINGILLYNYRDKTSQYTEMDETFAKVYLDEQQQRIYLTYTTSFSFWFTCFDQSLKQIQPIKNLHTKEIRGIILIGSKLYSYDEVNLFVFDRQSLQQQLTIECLNPKITSIIISQALNYVFIWNNNVIDKIQNSNIAIYSLINASQVFVIQNTQQIENGYINQVVVDEDSQQLFIAKDANYYLFAFDLKRFVYSGYYLISYDTSIIQMILIPELNMLVLLDASSVFVIRVENALNQGNNFKQLTSSQNTDNFINKNTKSAYLIDRDSVAWFLDYDKFDYKYLVQFTQIKFTQQTQNNIYVVLNNTLIQHDLNFNKLNQLDGRYRKLWYGTKNIYAETVLNELQIIDILTFQKANFTIKMPAYIKTLNYIENNSEVLILFVSGAVGHYNYQTNKQLYLSAVISDILDVQVDIVNRAFIHVRKLYVEMYCNYTANLTNYMTITKNRITYTSSKDIRSVVVDTDYKKLYLIHLSNPIITALNYTYNPTTNLTVAPAILGYLPQPTRTPNVMFILEDDVIQIQTPWQILQYWRSNLTVLKYYRDNKYLYSMINYYFSESQPQFRLISAQDGLLLLQRDYVLQVHNVVQKFNLDYPTVISFDINTQSSSYQFDIKGISNQKFFHYIFYLPIGNGDSQQTTKMNQCYLDIGSVQYFYNQDNQLTDLKNSLKFLGLSLKRSMIFVKPTLSFYLTSQMEELKSQIVFTSASGANDLIMQSTMFSKNLFQQLQLDSFNFDISQVQKISFNSLTTRITIKNAKFYNSGSNYTLSFNKVKYLILEDILVNSLTLSNSSIFFQISYCDQVYIKNITFQNITLSSDSVLFYFIGINNILIEDVTFKDITVDSNSNLSSIVFFQNTVQLRFNNFQIDNIVNKNNLNQEIYFLKSRGNLDVTLNNISYTNCMSIPFLDWKSSYELDQKIYYMSRDSLQVNQLVSYNIQNLKSPVIILSGFHFIIQNSNITLSTCLDCTGSALRVTSVAQISIENCEFKNNTSTFGGAIAIMTTKYDNVIIRNSTLQNNQAYASGGAIYLYQSDLDLFDCTITNNQATIGGGVRFIGIQPKFVDRITSDPSFKQNNTITNNKAEIHSNNYGSYTYSLSVKSNVNITQIQQKQRLLQLPNQNTDKQNLNNRILGSTTTANQDNIIKQYSIPQFQSGGNINLEFQIEDQEGQPIKFNLTKALQKEYHESIQDEITSFVIKAYVDSEDIKIYGQYITDYLQFDDIKSVFNIKEMNIVSIPEKYNEIYLEIPSIKRVSKSNSLQRTFDDGPYLVSINFQFRQCIPGEIYKESSGLYLCQECKEGFYSLVQPSIKDIESISCLRCPAECKYCFRNMMTLKKGYWKVENTTDSIVYCNNKPDNCNSDESKGYCIKGHFGPLCEYCDTYGEVWGERYMSDGKFNCIGCKQLQNDQKFLIPTIIVGVLMIVYMIFSIRIAIEISELIVIGYYLRRLNVISISKSAYLDTTNMNMKAMMNYMQVAQLVNTFEVELPEFMKILPQYLGSPVNNFMYTFDCYLSNVASKEFPMIFLRTIWTLTLPIMYLVGIGLVYLLLVSCKWARHNKSHLISGLVFLIFFLQPNMVSNLLGVMSCRQVDKQKYILLDISNLCYTEVHVKYILFICIPALLLWAVILPLTIVRKLYIYRNNLDNALIRIPFGFLYQDYKSKYFYWEFIKSYMKIVIIVIINFYGDPYNNKLVITMILFLFYMVFLQKAQPYQMLYFQNLDKKSITVLITIIMMNIFLYNRPDIYQQQIFYIIVLGIHNGYQAYLIYEVAKAKFSILFKTKINILKKYLIKKFPRLQRFIEIKEKKNFKLILLWKKVKKEIIEMSIKRQSLMKSRIIADEEGLEFVKKSGIFPPSSPNLLSHREFGSKLQNQTKYQQQNKVLNAGDNDICSNRSQIPFLSSNRDSLILPNSPLSPDVKKSRYNQLLLKDASNLNQDSKFASSNRLDVTENKKIELMNKRVSSSKDLFVSQNMDEDYSARLMQRKLSNDEIILQSTSAIYKNLSRVANQQPLPQNIVIFTSDANLQTPSQYPQSSTGINLEDSGQLLDQDEEKREMKPRKSIYQMEVRKQYLSKLDDKDDFVDIGNINNKESAKQPENNQTQVNNNTSKKHPLNSLSNQKINSTLESTQIGVSKNLGISTSLHQLAISNEIKLNKVNQGLQETKASINESNAIDSSTQSKQISDINTVPSKQEAFTIMNKIDEVDEMGTLTPHLQNQPVSYFNFIEKKSIQKEFQETPNQFETPLDIVGKQSQTLEKEQQNEQGKVILELQINENKSMKEEQSNQEISNVPRGKSKSIGKGMFQLHSETIKDHQTITNFHENEEDGFSFLEKGNELRYQNTEKSIQNGNQKQLVKRGELQLLGQSNQKQELKINENLLTFESKNILEPQNQEKKSDINQSQHENHNQDNLILSGENLNKDSSSFINPYPSNITFNHQILPTNNHQFLNKNTEEEGIQKEEQTQQKQQNKEANDDSDILQLYPSFL